MCCLKKEVGMIIFNIKDMHKVLGKRSRGQVKEIGYKNYYLYKCQVYIHDIFLRFIVGFHPFSGSVSQSVTTKQQQLFLLPLRKYNSHVCHIFMSVNTCFANQCHGQ